MTYSVQVPQMKSLQDAFAAAPALVATQSMNAINISLIALQRDAKKNAPINDGTLRSSILITPAKHVANTITGSVGTGIGYSIFQEAGTGIYGPYQTPIVPKNKPYLVFKTKDGRWIRTKSVKGVKPTWFMKNALEDNIPFITAQFQMALDAVLKTIGGAL